jgi:hypothetical protein
MEGSPWLLSIDFGTQLRFLQLTKITNDSQRIAGI